MIDQINEIAGGWYPRISPDGTRLCFGFWRGIGWAWTFKHATPHWVRDDVIQCGFYDSHTVMYQREQKHEAAGARAGVHLHHLVSGVSTPVALGLLGSHHDCADGHWGLNQTTTGDVYWDGLKIASGHCLGVSVAGTRLVTKRHIGHDRWVLDDYDRGVRVRELGDPPGQDNTWRAHADGTIGYGYFGHARVLEPDSDPVAITVVPVRAGVHAGEGVPTVARDDRGVLWCLTGCEVGSRRFMALRPYGATDAIVIPAGAIRPALHSLGNGLMLVAGESDRGTLTVWSVSTDERRETIEPPPLVVVPVNRPVVSAFYRYGQTMPSVRGNCDLPVTAGTMFVRTWTGDPIASYVAGNPDGDVTSLEQHAKAAKAEHGLPVIGYWTRKAQSVRVPQGVDWVGVEAYRRKTETIDDFARAILHAIQQCERVALICQCYTSNHDLTTDLASLVPVFARLLRDNPQVIAALVFSGSGRDTGLQDHPEVAPYWHELMTSIPGLPTLEERMHPPKITVESFEGQIDKLSMTLFDRANPHLNQRVRFFNDSGIMRAEWWTGDAFSSARGDRTSGSNTDRKLIK